MKIIISGIGGRMGNAVYASAKEEADIEVVAGLDIKPCDLPVPVYTGVFDVKEKADVIIDFSSPAALNDLLDYAVKSKTNLVLCATGYSEEDIEKIGKASEKIAVFRSANMSLGVNVLIDLVKKAAAILGGYDIEIIEKHHNKKKDAPSGTALMLANGIKEVKEEKYFVYGREGLVGERKKDEIGIHAVRGGNIVGEHEVIFAGEKEIITLAHSAADRSVFAYGAIQAAKYLAQKSCGQYNMQNLIDEN